MEIYTWIWVIVDLESYWLRMFHLEFCCVGTAFIIIISLLIEMNDLRVHWTRTWPNNLIIRNELFCRQAACSLYFASYIPATMLHKLRGTKVNFKYIAQVFCLFSFDQWNTIINNIRIIERIGTPTMMHDSVFDWLEFFFCMKVLGM